MQRQSLGGGLPRHLLKSAQMPVKTHVRPRQLRCGIDQPEQGFWLAAARGDAGSLGVELNPDVYTAFGVEEGQILWGLEGW